MVALVIGKITGVFNEIQYKGKVSDHFDGKKFFNNVKYNHDLPAFAFLKWRFNRTAGNWPKHVALKEHPVPLSNVSEAQLRVTLVGHATFLIQTGGYNILTDPVWSERVGFYEFGPRRVIEPAIKFSDLPKIDIVLISHNHYDHLDIPTLKKLNTKFSPFIITPLGVANSVIKKALGHCNCYEMDWWQKEAFTEDFKIGFVPAYHWSKRKLFDTNASLWGGYVIESKAGNTYFAGDTGIANGEIFKEIKEYYKDIKLALLPIGAYLPSWFMARNHISPKEAIEIFKMLDADYAAAMHYNTFELADDSYNQALHELQAELHLKAISPNKFITLEFGKAWDVEK